MALGTFVVNNTHGSILIEDGTAITPLSLTVPFDNGDFSITGLRKVLREVVAYESRGNFNSLAYGARVYPEFSFSAKVAEFTNAAGGSGTGVLSDMVLFANAFSAGISTSGDHTANPEIPITHKVTFTLEGTDFGHDADNTIVLDDCVLTLDISEGEPDTFSLSGICYATSITGSIAAAE